MHHLLTKVLSERDLSRAGDLFSVADSEIINDITNVLSEVEIIISQSDYIENKNDQSVVEICVTRVISCIRETKTFERYCQVLVNLLECCLKHNLQPGSNNEDPPHAKISSDIIASIFLDTFQNYNKKTIMETALPVAVKFLQKANKELSRNIASYLSLAAIEYVYLLSPYVQPIIDSILSGNYGLCRVLPQLYEISPNPLVQYTSVLVALISKCDLQDKLALLQLFGLISENEPAILENSVSQLCDVLADSTIIPTTMNVLLKLAEHKPILLTDHLDYIKNIVQKSGTSITTAAQIFTAVGKGNKERAQFALDFVLEHLPHADRTSQGILLREATLLCSTYPILFTDKVLACVRKKNILSQQQLQLQNNQENKMSGNVTIVKLNSTSPFLPTNQNTSQTVNSNNNHYDNIVLTTVINTSNGTTSSSTVYNYANNNNTTTSGSSSHVIPTANVQNSSDATTDNILSSPTNIVNYQSGANASTTSNTTPTATHTGYTRRAKLGDSRSTGRLHSGGNTHRSGSVGGLHKSMTRLSSSQQINQNGINPNSNCHSSGNVTQITSPVTNQNYVPPVPPLSSNVIVTGHNKWGIPSTKITSGGVTVTTSPSKGIRPHSQGPGMLMGSTGALGKGSNNGLSILNHSTGSIGVQQNTISVHHGSPDSPIMMNEKEFTLSTNTMPNNNINQINVTGGVVTVTTKRNDNTSVTLLNASSSCANQRLSVFEPYPMRDTVQHFCEKHLDKIKLYMESVSQRLPPPAKCTIEERRSKKLAKLHFACQVRGPHCLYSKTFFTMKTRNPKTWIHLMFLDLQARAQNALSSRDSGVSSLKHCWDILKCENKTFVTLITRAFPDPKEQDTLVNELRNSGFFDVFELGPNNTIGSSTEDFQHQWGCFLCNHPDKAIGFLNGNTQPVIEGQLKEKKGKWRLFRRWRTRYFTLSGAHLSCKGSSGGESIDINQIRSVKVSRGARNIPKAFEIFTGNQTLILKPKDGKNAEEWVQCLSIVVAHSQARDNHSTKTNSLPARGIGGSRTAF